MITPSVAAAIRPDAYSRCVGLEGDQHIMLPHGASICRDVVSNRVRKRSNCSDAWSVTLIEAPNVTEGIGFLVRSTARVNKTSSHRTPPTVAPIESDARRTGPFEDCIVSRHSKNPDSERRCRVFLPSISIPVTVRLAFRTSYAINVSRISKSRSL